jgi:hypothetical protein
MDDFNPRHCTASSTRANTVACTSAYQPDTPPLRKAAIAGQLQIKQLSTIQLTREEPQGQPRDPAGLSPARGPRRGACLHYFLAYCLHVTLARRLQALAPGLTPRSVLEKFAAVQMIDVHLPTTDGRELLLSRYTEPELTLLLEETQIGAARPTTPQNHRYWAAGSAVVPTFGGRFLRSQILRSLKLLESGEVGLALACPALTALGQSPVKSLSTRIRV